MELLLISDSKLKVTLTNEDMKRLDISCDGLDYDNTETRRAFWQILDEAKSKTGFDAARDRVFIQVYPSKCGGCEMYVIKLKGLFGKEKEGKMEVAKTRASVFSFDSMTSLLPVCRQLKGLGYGRESAAYIGDDGRFYLVVNEETPTCQRGSFGEFSFLEEYGRRHTEPSRAAYIREHCRAIEEKDAVNILASFA